MLKLFRKIVIFKLMISLIKNKKIINDHNKIFFYNIRIKNKKNNLNNWILVGFELGFQAWISGKRYDSTLITSQFIR